MMNERFMKNPHTGVIFKYNPKDMATNSKLVECTKEGVVFGKSTTPVDELYERIAELERIVAEKNLRIEALENALSISVTENKKNETFRRKELEELKVDDLKTLAADLGISADGKKAELIESILAASAINNNVE